MPSISLCMITRNEEQFLEQCLNSIKDFVDEIIIVDTGSTDNTKKIAAKFTTKIYDFTWIDDFAAARNESLKYATGDWILVLDADETIDKKTKEEIIKAINNNNADAYTLAQLHYTNKFTNQTDFIEINHSQFKGFYVSYVIRLFKNLNGIYFDYCVHETVRKTLLKNNKIITELPAVIHHYQELKSFDNIKEKQETYFKLSLNNIKKYPHYAKSYNDVAIYYATYKEENDKALEYCKKAIELAPRKIEYLLNYSYRLRDLKKHEEAILFLKRIKDKYDDERIYRALGYLYYTIKQYHFALEMYEKAIKLNSPIKEQLQKNIETIKKEQLSL